MTINLELDEQQSRRLQDAARRLNVSVSDLAKAAINDLLAQPQMSFGGDDLYPTLADKAAALCFSLVLNHPFVDGNKRIGHAAMETFLVCSAPAVRSTNGCAGKRLHPIPVGDTLYRTATMQAWSSTMFQRAGPGKRSTSQNGGLNAEPSFFGELAFSPDGRHLALPLGSCRRQPVYEEFVIA